MGLHTMITSINFLVSATDMFFLLLSSKNFLKLRNMGKELFVSSCLEIFLGYLATEPFAGPLAAITFTFN